MRAERRTRWDRLAAAQRFSFQTNFRMCEPLPAPDVAELAARAVLLTLSAALAPRGGDRAPELRFVGSTATAEQAARRLANLDFPVFCKAARGADGAVEVFLEQDPDPAELRWSLHGTHPLRTALSKTVTSARAAVLLAGGGESLLLPGAAIQAWLDRYTITMPFELSGASPVPEQLGQGIVWVLHAGPPAISTTDVDDLGLPEPLRGIIAEEFRRAVREHRADGSDR